MSRTYTHAPLWVLVRKEGIIDHDHRFGTCEMNPDSYMNTGRSRPSLANHRKKCSKYFLDSFLCVHKKGRKKGGLYFDEDTQTYLSYTYYEVNDSRQRCDYKGGSEHWVEIWKFDKNIPCECDAWNWWSDKAYCKYDIPNRYYYSSDWGYTGKKFNRNANFIRPKRRCAKNSLKNIKDNWNGADIEDDEMWDDDYNYISERRTYDKYWR